MEGRIGGATEIPEGVVFEVLEHGRGWTDSGSIMTGSLIRFDLSSGSQQQWGVAGDSGWAAFVGLDSKGSPLVALHIFTPPASTTLFVYTAPQARTAIASLPFEPVGLRDRHGTGLSAAGG